MHLTIIANKASWILRDAAPVDTGNLKENAIRIVYSSKDECTLGVDGFIAPYAVYTNEPWTSPKWNGIPNPNEHWIDNAVKRIAEMIAEQLGGTLELTDNDT
jgi:hypothetical protein